MSESTPALRILSGIQPSGLLHLGNYFGMMRSAIELQDQGDAFYFIADLHALTTLRDPQALRDYSLDLAIDFLACGLDSQKACFFRQSDVLGVTELAWILGTLAPMGLLERAHSYKDKVAKGISPSYGLFAYPILMAADILLYDSDLIPVGQDQKQHVEITRDLAIKFNTQYGETFKLPQASIQNQAALVPGLNGAKMSKSYHNTLSIFESEKSLKQKILSLVTDSTPVTEPKPVENSTILGLYQFVASQEEWEQMKAEFEQGGIGYGTFKKRLFEALWEYFTPFRKRREELVANPEFVHQILAQGAARANTIAASVLKRAQQAVGIK